MSSHSPQGSTSAAPSTEDGAAHEARQRVAGATRLVLLLSALALAVLGQALLVSGHVLWAITPYVVAVVAVTTAVSNSSFVTGVTGSSASHANRPASPTPALSQVPSAGGRRQRRVAIALLVLALVLMASSLFLFPKGPPNALGWWFFGISVPLAAAAALMFDGRICSVVSKIREGAEISLSYRSALPCLGLTAILLLAALLRLYNLEGLPAGLWFDEADNIRQAADIRSNPGNALVFIRSTNLPSLFLMPIALVIDLAGISITTSRIVSVAFGIAGVAAMFFMGRTMLGTTVGLLAAFLTAVMRWDINWSRIGMHGITAPLFAALTAYLTFKAVNLGRRSDFVLAGGVMGLGMWFYASFRLFPLVVGLVLIHALLFNGNGRRRLLANIVFMVLAALFVAAPVVQSAIVDSEDFFDRTKATSIFTDRTLGESLDQMKTSLGKHLAMFHLKGDPNPRHNLPLAPMLDFLSGALLILGAAIAFTRWRNAALIILPFWVLLMLLPGVITVPWEAPQSLRSITAIPAVAALIAVAVSALWVAGRGAPWASVRRYTPVFVAVLLAVIAFSNISTYFGRQANHPDVYASFSTDETLMASDMELQQSRGYSLLVSPQFQFGLTAHLLADRPRLDTISAPQNIPLDPDQVWHGAAIYLEPREAGLYELLKAYYPNGEFREYRPPAGGDAMFYSAIISRARLNNVKGLVETRTYSDGLVEESIRLDSVSAWALDVSQDQVPFDLEWEGTLHIIQSGEYVLALDGDTDAQVFLDDRLILASGSPEARIRPAVGLHTLRLTGRVENRSETLRLLWQMPGGELTPIPAANLYHGDVRPVGLSGRFFKGNERQEEESADAMRVTPMANTFWYYPVLTESYYAVWGGKLDVPEDGEYRFSVKAFGDLKLYIDGALRADTQGESESVFSLTEGSWRIRLEYFSEFAPSDFEIQWAPPGQSFGQIPIERLSPDNQQMFELIGGN